MKVKHVHNLHEFLTLNVILTPTECKFLQEIEKLKSKFPPPADLITNSEIKNIITDLYSYGILVSDIQFQVDKLNNDPS